MQVLLNSETQIQNHLAMTTHLHQVVDEVLGHYGECITRIDGHMSDANSAAKTDTDDIHLTLEASLPGLAPVVVKDRAATPHQVIQGAVGKLDRAVAHVLGKREARRERPNHEDPSANEPT